MLDLMVNLGSLFSGALLTLSVSLIFSQPARADWQDEMMEWRQGLKVASSFVNPVPLVPAIDDGGLHQITGLTEAKKRFWLFPQSYKYKIMNHEPVFCKFRIKNVPDLRTEKEKHPILSRIPKPSVSGSMNAATLIWYILKRG